MPRFDHKSQDHRTMYEHNNAILEAVRANQALLEACSLHAFQPVNPGQFGTKYHCTACKGVVDGLTARWYGLGLTHERNEATLRQAAKERKAAFEAERDKHV